MNQDITQRTGYAFGRRVDMDYEEAVEKVRDTLKEQGFGVLTEIDVKKTLKEKRGTDFRRYVILEACNPELAEQALQAEVDIGALLPCNVVVFEDDEGGSVIEAMDPQTILGLVDNPAVGELASQVREQLETAISEVTSGT